MKNLYKKNSCDSYKEYLFVYGSLKRGFENHSILSTAKYISKAQTTSKFAMFIEDNHNYPYIIESQKVIGMNIDGELYEIINKDTLNKVNAFEGVPFHFKCEDIYVQTDKNKSIKAKAYILATKKIPLNQKPIKVFKSRKIKVNIDFDEYDRVMLGFN